MALTLTLAQIREEVGLCLDAPIGDAYLSTATVDRWINMAIQEYASLCAQYGLGPEKRATLTGSSSTTAGADGFPANEILALPADFAALKSLSYQVNGYRVMLRLMAESDRESYWAYPVTNYGPPEAYALVDATPSLAARARVWPPMQSAYSFELIYRPQVDDTSTEPSVSYLPGTEDIIIARVAMKQATREGIQEPNQFAALQERYQLALAALQRAASSNGGVSAMRNTRDRSRLGRGGPWL
jgi:hypothetical protein